MPIKMKYIQKYISDNMYIIYFLNNPYEKNTLYHWLLKNYTQVI